MVPSIPAQLWTLFRSFIHILHQGLKINQSTKCRNALRELFIETSPVQVFITHGLTREVVTDVGGNLRGAGVNYCQYCSYGKHLTNQNQELNHVLL